MRRAGGYLLIVGPEGRQECDSFTCAHCQAVVFVPPKAPPSESGGWCGRCSKLICANCAARAECTPFERVLEAYEARERLLKSIIG